MSTEQPAPTHPEPGPSAEAPVPLALREPAHRVCPRAVNYWRTTSALGGLVEIAIAVTVYVLVPARPWWATALLVLVVVPALLHPFVVPPIKYRVHRWEVDDLAVHTREGWLTVETRIAPLNRVQTVDSQQGPLMRVFGLASITVTTASAAGPITIEGLDATQARELVARLTAITGTSEDDAT